MEEKSVATTNVVDGGPEAGVLSLSVVIPAKNEALAIGRVVSGLMAVLPYAEVVVVSDGSVDATSEVARTAGAIVVEHPYSLGNGAAIKAGARAATGEVLVFMDGDGQHDPEDIPAMLDLLSQNRDMVVGARGRSSQASVVRGLANGFYNRLASYMTGHRIDDLTSGFRAVRRDKFLEFVQLLPNGFSYPTTITMAFFRRGYVVDYLPIFAAKREGESHIHPLKDGLRFLLIIFKIGSLYSPLKLFVPISMMFFLLGLGHYLNTFLTEGRFTNMSALMLSISVIVFLIGLVSEQITQLTYLQASDRPRE